VKMIWKNRYKRKLLTEKEVKIILKTEKPMGINVMLSINKSSSGIEPAFSGVYIRRNRYREWEKY